MTTTEPDDRSRAARAIDPERFRRVVWRAVALPVILMVALAGLLLWQIQRLMETAEWVEHTDRVIAAAHEAERLMVDLQSGYRGYLLVGRREYLAPHERARAQVDAHMAALEALVADNPAQVGRARRLRAMLGDFVAYTDGDIERFDAGEPLANYIGRGVGKPQVDAMRGLFAEFIALEARLRDARADEGRRAASTAVAAGVGASVLLGAGLAAFFAAQLAAVNRAFAGALATAQAREADVRRLVGTLEDRVAGRTAELSSANAELAGERAFAAAVLENIADGVVACDADGTLTLFNAATRRLHGLPVEPLPPERWAERFDLFEPDGVTPMPPDRIPLRRALAGEVVVDAEMVIAPKATPGGGGDGGGDAPRPRTVLCSGRSLLDGAGAKVGAVVSMRDVTDLKRAEAERGRYVAELDRQRAFSQAILDNLNDGIVACDAQGRFLLFNDRMKDQARQSEVSLPMEEWARHYHLYEADGVTPMPSGRAPLPRALAGETFDNFEVVMGEPGGPRTVSLFSGRPFRDDAGNLLGAVVSSRDITGRKEAERALRASVGELERERSFLRAVLDTIGEGVAACDAGGHLTLFNGAIVDQTRRDVEPVPPEEWARTYSLFEPDGRTPLPADQTPLWRALRGETVRDAEIVFAPPGGPVVTALLSGGPFFDEAGNLLGAVVSSRDITARKADEAALRRSHDELQRSNRELQDFASVASHDLQEPLRKIQAFGDRLSARHAGDLGEHGRDYLARMQAAAGRMSRLINDLLTFSRVTTRARAFEPVDLADLMATVADDLHARVEREGGRVDLPDPAGPHALPTVDGDPTQLRQLFQNLIGNGLKFHPPDRPPVVTVLAVGDDAEAVTVEVSDNGIGFDEKYLDRIFDIFQRLHGRTEYEGTGIGLAVCRKIADRHGGTIAASSAPGEGATFRVTLPRRQPRAADEPATAEAA